MDYRGRRDRVRAQLDGFGAQALLVSNPSNIRYLTGFSGSNGAVVVGGAPDLDRLATDSRYYTQAENECPDVDVLASTTSVLEVAGKWWADQKLGPIGFESHHGGGFFQPRSAPTLGGCYAPNERLLPHNRLVSPVSE